MSALFKDSLKYCRLVPRKQEKQSICNEGNVPKELLEELFGTKIESRTLYLRLREIFLQDCERLLDKYYDNRYKFKLKQSTINALKFLYTKVYSNVEKVVTLEDNPRAEHLINLMFYLVANQMNWSEWLICMPSGRKILFPVFDTENNDAQNIKQNIKQIIKMLSSVSVLQNYDNIFFREQFKFLFNDIIVIFAEFLRKQGLENIGVDITEYFSLWIVNQITTESFCYLLITGVTILSSKINK